MWCHSEKMPNSSSASAVKQVIDDLKSAKANIKCGGNRGVLKKMEDLGFVSKKSSRGKHMIFTHPKLSVKLKADGKEPFYTVSIDCGRNPILPNYVVTIISVLTKYQDELEEILDAD